MSEEYVLNTNCGRVKGLIKTSSLGDRYYSFQGIPYAQNPIGDLRFRAPVPIDTCDDLIDATREGPVPYYVETHFEGLPKSENCLHLNVYSKNVNALQKLAVIIFIYGGAFHSGSSTTKLYGPDYLMQKDVVLVTFNYRVGPLGFLHFDDPSLNVPGNAGLKDQLLVLKWVQDNIEQFGGDKNNVTLVGDSAGAGSVSYHLISEASRDLVHRAILMSGNVFCGWGVTPPNHLSIDLARVTGWDGNGGEEGALAHLMAVDPETLTKLSTTLLTHEQYSQGIVLPFAPIVEPYVSDTCMIRDNPVKQARNAWSKNIDIIIGHTSNEGSMEARSNNFDIYKISNDFRLFIPYNARNKSELTLENEVKSIKKLYNDFDKLYKDNLQQYFDFVSDTRFVHGTHRNILSRLNDNGLGKTYMYRFSYDFPTRNHHKIAFGATGYTGASHADDLSYIFLNGWRSPPEKGTDEWNAIQKMVDLFTGFAIHGREKLKELNWDEVKKDSLPYEYKCMEIGNEWMMKKAPEISRMSVWDNIYPENELF